MTRHARRFPNLAMAPIQQKIVDVCRFEESEPLLAVNDERHTAGTALRESLRPRGVPETLDFTLIA